MKRYVVIGGGITGLAAAWRLKQKLEAAGRPYSLLVLEASAYAGTSIQTVRREGFLLETGPDCFLSAKPRGVGLAREIGLEDELIGTLPDHRQSFIVRGGRLHPVPEGFYLLGPSKLGPFLRSGLLTWGGKWRALMEPLIPKRKIRPPRLALSQREREGDLAVPLPGGEGGRRQGEGNVSRYDESLGSFVRRRLGKEMLDWLAQPLVAGIYGADPDELSLRATFPLFQDMEEKYGSVLLGLKLRGGAAVQQASGPRYSLFVSFRNGMQTFTDRLIERIGPTRVQKQSRARRVSREEDGWKIEKANGDTLTAEAVLIALPGYAAAELLGSLDADLASEIGAVPYRPAATMNFAFREQDLSRPINGIGFVVPQREARAVMGATVVPNKFAGRAPKGFTLLRAFIGGAGGEGWLALSDAALTRQVLGELQSLAGVTGTPKFGVVERYAKALPQYAVGHVDRILRIEERALRWKGLALAGNWLRGVGIPDCIESGERAAESLLRFEVPAEPVLP